MKCQNVFWEKICIISSLFKCHLPKLLLSMQSVTIITLRNGRNNYQIFLCYSGCGVGPNLWLKFKYGKCPKI